MATCPPELIEPREGVWEVVDDEPSAGSCDIEGLALSPAGEHRLEDTGFHWTFQPPDTGDTYPLVEVPSRHGRGAVWLTELMLKSVDLPAAVFARRMVHLVAWMYGALAMQAEAPADQRALVVADLVETLTAVVVTPPPLDAGTR